MAAVTEFKWKLPKFSAQFIKNSGNNWSKIFSLNGKPETKFKVHIRSYRDIQLYCDKIGKAGELNLVSKFWLESGKNKFCERVKTCAFKNSDDYSEPFLTESDLADLKKFIVGDVVTICLQIKLGDSVRDFDDKKAKTIAIKAERIGIGSFVENLGSKGSEVTPKKPSLLEQLALNISKLYSKGHHDMTIQADGKEFKAFKNVLMAHSQIFEVMLSSPNSIEARDNLIKIEDTDAETIEALVKWMHFLEVENLNEISCKLYKVAHKYQIAPLLEICTQTMSTSLKVDHLPSRIILAYIYEIDELKRNILHFVQKDHKNVQTLIASNEWIDFTYENRELAMKVAKELCK